jgi:hypothetical protein
LNQNNSFNVLVSRSLLESSVQPYELVVPKVSEPDNNRKCLILPSCLRVNSILERSHVEQDVEDLAHGKALLNASLI